MIVGAAFCILVFTSINYVWQHILTTSSRSGHVFFINFLFPWIIMSWVHTRYDANLLTFLWQKHFIVLFFSFHFVFVFCLVNSDISKVSISYLSPGYIILVMLDMKFIFPLKYIGTIHIIWREDRVNLYCIHLELGVTNLG